PSAPTPYQQFFISILSNPDYFQRAGNTNSLWLGTLYKRLLGRAPDVGSFTNNLATLIARYRPQRQAAALALTGSTEYHTRFISDAFVKYLRRSVPPSQGEMAPWLSLYASGKRDEDVIAGLISSPEYFNNVGGGSNTQWI